jgi:lipoprotein-anchoring transpeptidase ErfK/SrfK
MKTINQRSTKTNRGGLTRRDLLRVGGLGLIGALMPFKSPSRLLLEFPQAERLGRITAGMIDLKASASTESITVGTLYQDAVVVWNREVVGYNPNRTNQRFIETPDGYLWGGQVQPVRNEANLPLDSLPESSLGPGFWGEVSVPYVDLELNNPPARAPWLKNRMESGLPPRFYYKQIVWVDDIKTESDGQAYYRLNERYGYGDRFWAEAEALRPLTLSDLEPIRPQAENKRVVVNVSNQTMSCYEGENEVYFCRVSTGAQYNAVGDRVGEWSTPPGSFRIWRKAISLPLSGGSVSFGWDLPAVGWISLFIGTGVAIHSTYWHNNYGEPSSRGCVNASPEDAHWVFRWSMPGVSCDPGDVTVGMPGGTQIDVVES